jgi:hypothetical protein
MIHGGTMVTMDEAVVLIAGEVDGRELVVSHTVNRVYIPARVEPTWGTEDDDGLTEPLHILEYDLVLDRGHPSRGRGYPSRDDQGRLRYQLRP